MKSYWGIGASVSGAEVLQVGAMPDGADLNNVGSIAVGAVVLGFQFNYHNS